MAAAHAIQEEFPGDADRIHRLKIADGDFARLLEEYDRVAGAEARQAPMFERAGTDLRKRRAMLKDEIAPTIGGR